jgi:MFS family permease
VFTFSAVSLGRRGGFGTLWAASTVSALGDGMRFAALPLLAATLSTDARAVSAVTLAEQLPWLGVGLAAGAVADRLDRRWLMWTVDAVRALLAAVLALAALTGHASIPLLCAAGFLLSCGQALYNGASPGLLTALVEPTGLPRANARIQAGGLITDTLLGTPLGAVAFTVAAALPFGVDAVSFAVSAALVARLPGRDRSPRDRATTLRQDIAEGVRWLAGHRVLRMLCLLIAVGNMVMFMLIAVLVLYARRVLGLGPAGTACWWPASPSAA